MKKNTFPTIVKFGLMIFMTGVITACQFGSFAAATATPVPANTKPPLPTNTSTSEPSPTPPPTSTFPPTATPEPTPAAVGEPVIGKDIEITVIDALVRNRVYLGGSYLYVPNPGYLLVDMGVRVKNLNPSKTIFIPWNQIYVVEDNGDSWYPLWGSTKVVASGETYDPFFIGISSIKIDGGGYIRIENDTYLRMIFIVRDSNQKILFGIGTSPQVEITLHK